MNHDSPGRSRDLDPGKGPESIVARSAHLDAASDEQDRALILALDRIEHQMADGMLRARDSVVALEYAPAGGSPNSRRVATGVVINSRGDILSVQIDQPAPAGSSAHGPTHDKQVIVARDAAGQRHLAEWVAIDPETGITLLRISPRAVRPIQIADSAPTLGTQVFVVGNPLGLGHSVSRGHIAGLDRALKVGACQIGGLIQIQAPLYPGDSGAAVVDLHGQLVGLIRSGLAVPATTSDQSESDNNFGFALGTRDILWIADQLRSRGCVDRAYLGVRLEPVTAEAISPALADPAQASATGEPAVDGALLLEVLTGSPAALAGLSPGDKIKSLDGQPIHSSNDLKDRLDRLPSQTTVHLDVVRGRGVDIQRLRIELRTTSRPRALSGRIGQGLARSGKQTGLPSESGTRSQQPLAEPRPPASAPASSSSPDTALSDRLDHLEQRLERLEQLLMNKPGAQEVKPLASAP
ncbi:MAG: S1C family serine protease [Isosphaeraceae bacterium]